MNTFLCTCTMKFSYFVRDGIWIGDFFAPRSYSLTTRLSRRKEGVIVSWLIVLPLWLFLYPLGLPIGSEVASDLNSELSGLNNLCSSTFLASIVLYSKSRRRKQNEHVDLPAHTSPHKHSVTVGLELSSLE